VLCTWGFSASTNHWWRLTKNKAQRALHKTY
jgi:hypothetical protein